MYDVILIPISDWLPQNKCQIYGNILFCSYFGDANYVGCMTVIIAAVLLMMMLPQQQKQQLHVLLLLLLLPILLYYYYYYFLFKRRLLIGYFTHRFCIKLFQRHMHDVILIPLSDWSAQHKFHFWCTNMHYSSSYQYCWLCTMTNNNLQGLQLNRWIEWELALGALMCPTSLLCLLNPLSVDYGSCDICHKNGLKFKKHAIYFDL